VSSTLHVRRLGMVEYTRALALQHELHERRGESWLLLLEHPHVYTLGVRARSEHLLVDPASVGATLGRADRGGDITYHGPGQLVGYPIVDVPMRRAAIPDHVHTVEQVMIDALGDCGIHAAARRPGYPGVWAGDAKIGAVGVRITRGRSMHGFALNVDPDLSMFDHIVPCGIHDLTVTSMAALGSAATVDDVADAVSGSAARRWGDGTLDDDFEASGAYPRGSRQAARRTGTFEKPATFDMWTRRSPSSSTS
jgi:lipoic acid synthetase